MFETEPLLLEELVEDELEVVVGKIIEPSVYEVRRQLFDFGLVPQRG